MKVKVFTAALPLALILALLVSIMPACRIAEAAESYMAIIPKVLQANSTEEVSLALFKGENLISGTVEVALLKENEEILRVTKDISGQGTVIHKTSSTHGTRADSSSCTATTVTPEGLATPASKQATRLTT